jgi:fructoselysine-6-P-deglycase FrlB-like protein
LCRGRKVAGCTVAHATADREQVRAVLPSAHTGTVLLARGSSDNVAVYGRYLIETPEVVETAASMRRAGAVVIGIANEPGSPPTSRR